MHQEYFRLWFFLRIFYNPPVAVEGGGGKNSSYEISIVELTALDISMASRWRDMKKL